MARVDQGHWSGVKVDPEEHFGFIYMMTDLTTGEFYVGKKNVWIKKPRQKGCKTAIASPVSPKWKPCCWKESDWRTYKGSSKYWSKHMKNNPDHKYDYRVLACCGSKGVLHFAELVAIIFSKSLVSEKGFNYAAPSIKYRVNPELWANIQTDPGFQDWF